MYQYTIQSEFQFDDLVNFNATHCSGRGRILDIAVGKEGLIYYIIILDDGNSVGGIYPHEVTRVVDCA